MKVSRFAKITVLLNCAVPAILLTWDAFRGQLVANPVNFAIHTTGILSLIFLFAHAPGHSAGPDITPELAGSSSAECWGSARSIMRPPIF